MGVYLNSKNPYGIFLDEAASMYFIDKSEMLLELLPMVENSEDIIENFGSGTGKSNRYLCITRPRRFGKTVMATMIASFFGKGKDSRHIFEKLKVRNAKEAFEAHINKHNVIYISLNEVPQNCSSYEKYIGRIEKRLRNDLKSQFPDIEIDEEEPVWDILNDIYESEDENRFIFVLDEWDYIFHRDFVREKDKKAYIEFLSNLLKGKSYVELAYMTGILPIAKYSSGSELNMFYDLWFSPILVNELAEILALCMEKDVCGLYNICATGSISKYDMAMEIKKAFELTGTINRASMKNFEFRAPRTQNMGMDNAAIRKLLNISIATPQEGVARFRQLWDEGYPQLLKKGGYEG